MGRPYERRHFEGGGGMNGYTFEQKRPQRCSAFLFLAGFFEYL